MSQSYHIIAEIGKKKVKLTNKVVCVNQDIHSIKLLRAKVKDSVSNGVKINESNYAFVIHSEMTTELMSPRQHNFKCKKTIQPQSICI